MNKTIILGLGLLTANIANAVIDYQVNNKDFYVMGHRGAMGTSGGVGNTMEDVLTAVESAANSFEVDVHITADNVVVLGHDEDISKTCDWEGSGSYSTKNVSQMSFAEHQQWDCDDVSGIQPYPTLTQVLDLRQWDDFLLNVELKSASIDKNEYVYQAIQAYNQSAACNGCLSNNITIQSFDAAVLSHWAANYQAILGANIGYLTAFDSSGERNKAKDFANIYSPMYIFMGSSAVGDAASKGMKTVPWTANGELDFSSLINKQVDGIITDNKHTLSVYVNGKNTYQKPANPNLIDNGNAEQSISSSAWVDEEVIGITMLHATATHLMALTHSAQLNVVQRKPSSIKLSI